MSEASANDANALLVMRGGFAQARALRSNWFPEVATREGMNPEPRLPIFEASSMGMASS